MLEGLPEISKRVNEFHYKIVGSQSTNVWKNEPICGNEWWMKWMGREWEDKYIFYQTYVFLTQNHVDMRPTLPMCLRTQTAIVTLKSNSALCQLQDPLARWVVPSKDLWRVDGTCFPWYATYLREENLE
jgi:hypothetical protein